MTNCISILDFSGVDPTGATDSSAGFQAALNACSDNTQLDLCGGTYRLDSAVTRSGVNRLRISGRGATIVEGTVGTTALFDFTSCPRLRVDDIHFVGSETYSYFSTNSPMTRQFFLRISTSHRVRIADITGEAKRGHIALVSCNASVVEKSDFAGFFQNLSLGAQADANNCSTVEFSGGFQNKAIGCHAENHGSCVLFVLSGIGHQAIGCSGRNLHDNGVYGSSGSRLHAISCDFSDVAGSGVKLRGSQNVAALNTVKAASIAVSITGNGTSPDSFGANGFGNIAALNSGDSIAGDGIGVGTQDGYYQRNAIISLNAINGLTATGGFAGVRGGLLAGGVVSLNSFSDIGCDYGILLAGTTSLVQKSLVISGNSISSLTGAQQGIRVIYAMESTVSQNVGTAVPNLVQGRFVTDSSFSFNVNPGGTSALSLTSANSNANNLVVGQHGASTVDAATHPAFSNFPVATQPALSATPKTVGQVTVVGGVGYLATGTSSSSDWTQIT